jgi:hypothetical protein
VPVGAVVVHDQDFVGDRRSLQGGCVLRTVCEMLPSSLWAGITTESRPSIPAASHSASGGKQVRDNIHSWDLVNAFWHFVQDPRAGAIITLVAVATPIARCWKPSPYASG